ncbi:cysteine desulfurase family protein [Candidatus Walczuchella endosymbiont of Icerya purchasi]|uniref:cysteine desulfurase family protein n=1 Tax=Candidatus Walczuchella endosymbiont of Icerya purchasi TaxID=3066219 RepID=UPI00313CD148
MNIYLDNAATTPIRPEVIKTLTNTLLVFFGNPSSNHKWGRSARFAIENSRRTIAKLLNVRSSEIIFTSGGTEVNNMILTTVIQQLKVKRIITSPIEHKSVLETSSQLFKNHGIILEFVKLKSHGRIDLEDLENRLQNFSFTTLVSLMHANNEIGNILPLKKVSAICKKYKAWFHSDTVQTIGHYKLNMQKIGVDFASAGAHKFYGPLGVGFAFIRKGSLQKGFIHGGVQELGIRAGTENLYGIVAMAKALECSMQYLDKEHSYIEDIKKYAIFELKKAIPEVQFNGLSDNLQQSIYTILSISLPKPDDVLHFCLDLKGIAVAQGSACLSGIGLSSHVIHTISGPENRTTLRISLGITNTKKDIDALIIALKECINTSNSL